LTVQIQGDGPIGSILVDADAEGHVRGYVKNPHVHLPSNAQGKLDVGGAVGNGMLYVIRDYGLKDLYRGSSELQTGEISDDFTYYFAVSEQTPSAVGAGVLVDTDGSVIASGGFILQLLPGHDESDVTAVEQHLAKLTSVTDFLKTGATAEELLHFLAPDARDLSASGVAFQCNCSRERLQTVLTGLGRGEIESMIRDQGQAELVCRFCNEVYLFTRDDLEGILSDMTDARSEE
jgi:molecular chaperone Hsp33